MPYDGIFTALCQRVVRTLVLYSVDGVAFLAVVAMLLCWRPAMTMVNSDTPTAGAKQACSHHHTAAVPFHDHALNSLLHPDILTRFDFTCYFDH